LASTINAKSTGSGSVETTADASGVLALQTGGVTAMTIDTSQNVGIGTTSPASKLNLQGSSSDYITFSTSGTNKAYVGVDNGTPELVVGASAGDLVIRSNQKTWFGIAGGGQAGVIDSSGNWGIGTSSPNQTLEIKNGSDYQIRVNNGTTAQSYDIGRSTTNGLLYFYGRQTGFTGYVWSGVDGERMRIDSNGYLLIGTSNSTPSATNPGVRIALADTASIWARNGTSTTAMINFVNSNGTVGHIDTSNSTTSYVTSSDYRLKENITPMTGALNKVSQLKPVTYTWKIDGLDGEGFIAHELAEVCPHAVSGEKDAVDDEGNPIYQGIDTSFLVATLTAAIQELAQQNQELKSRIEALEGAN
jgi:hypothetical protein